MFRRLPGMFLVFSQAKRPFSEVAPSCKPKNGTFPQYSLSGSLKFNSLSVALSPCLTHMKVKNKKWRGCSSSAELPFNHFISVCWLIVIVWWVPWWSKDRREANFCRESERVIFNKLRFIFSVAGEGKRDALSIPCALDLWTYPHMGIAKKLISVPRH